ncbi:MAG TPA: membrane dipeptidase [Phycisphaerales bacterium]|nr:membrane dipeptidase [Phycisphaerales bacterium]
MKRTLFTGWLFAVLIEVALSGGIPDQTTDMVLLARARALAHEVLLLDSHIDVPYRLEEHDEDISRRTESGDFDYPRARMGGLDAVFAAVYVPPRREDDGTAGVYADETIDRVEQFWTTWPDYFAAARSPDDVRRQFGNGRISIILAIENGAPIQGDLSRVQHYYDRGVRYITLCHGQSNHICDSSYDTNRPWQGLSPFGKRLVAEMNRVGMMIDVSHVSDEAFWDVLEHSRAPVIASHSSCRCFTPGWERNLTDEMIRALADKGGIVQINFGDMFCNERVYREYLTRWEAIDAHIAEHGLEGQERGAFIEEYCRAHPIARGTVRDVGQNIDHAVKLIGVDQVGLGSDFDGVGPHVPVGLKDVSAYPNLLAELLSMGYSEADLRKICGQNFLRVWQRIDETARRDR